MLNFNYYTPTKIIFGKDTEKTVGKEIHDLGYKKVLVHYGSGKRLQESGLLDNVHRSLTEYGVGYVDLGGVVPNPRMSLVKQGIELCKREGVDFILAIGGGSPIDSAKAIGYGLANSNVDLVDVYMARVTVDKCYPIGCILTIAAAGSEMSNSSVITIEEGQRKRFYDHDSSRPKFSILNPEMTYTLPAYQTASGAVDIMMHTMERYFTTVKDVVLIDRMAEGLLVSVKEAAVAAVKNPYDYEARATLMWGGSLSHNGLLGTGRVGAFGPHMIEHEVSGMFDVTHGAGLSAVWSSWARYVYKTNVGRFARFAVEVFGVKQNYENLEETALAGISAWEDWCHSINMPVSLSELGVHPTDEQIVDMAKKATFDDAITIDGFQPLTSSDVVAILTAAK